MVVPTYDAVKFPSDIETILITGAGGMSIPVSICVLRHADPVPQVSSDSSSRRCYSNTSPM